MSAKTLTAFDQGGPIVLRVWNRAKTPLGIDFVPLLRVLQDYIQNHLSPVWGVSAKIAVPETYAMPGEWTLVFVDEADEDDSLGYHDLTRNGFPFSRVFVKEALRSGEPISITATHELAEMLVDPAGQLWARSGNTFYAYEVADPVEETHFEIQGVQVSNFVYPSFYEDFHKSGRFDHLGLVKKPLETLPGGYQVVHSPSGRTHEIFGSVEKRVRFGLEDRRGHRSEARKWSMSY